MRLLSFSHEMRRRDEVKNRGKKTLQLYNENKKIVPYFINQSDLCESIFDKVIIGEGVQGKVYKIKFKGDRKTYIIKQFSYEEYSLSSQERHDNDHLLNSRNRGEMMVKLLDNIRLTNKISWKKVLTYNNWNKSDKVMESDLENLLIPSYLVLCRIEEQYFYVNNVYHNSKIHIYPGDYVCLSNNYTEVLISLLVSELVKKGNCIHFVMCYSLITCKDETQVYFMEKMDKSLEDMVYEEEYVPEMSQLFSIYAGIYAMTTLLNVDHNDLGFRNILVKLSSNIKADDNSVLSDYDYIQYNIGNLSYYFRMPEYICKISDFGYAHKYSRPKILRHQIMSNMYKGTPNFDTGGLQDVLYFTSEINWFIKGNEIVENVAKYFFKDIYLGISKIEQFYENEKSGIIGTLFSEYNIDELPILTRDFFNKVFHKYQTPPREEASIYIAADLE
jgi:serine/threonine protein kinase